MKELLPEAFYDSLSIGSKLHNALGTFKREEIHLFSYFSSILFLYKGNPLADWKYRFILNSQGFPFSDELDNAITRHILNGILKDGNIFLDFTARGSEEFDKIRAFSYLSKREEYIEASCVTNIILPYSKTIRALSHDPEIRKLQKLNTKQEIDNEIVYSQFKELSRLIGIQTKDLIIPAVNWVNYLYEEISQEENNNVG
jgi:hypothetical protein